MPQIVRRVQLRFVAAAVCACASTSRAQVTIETVMVGNPGNAGELSGAGAGGAGPDRICGAVDHVYRIGKFEVTAGQYTDFLNAVAATDAYGLYTASMWDSEYGCKIGRTGSSGSYSYSVPAQWADRPVDFVSWGDAARFANWLHNGQPTGAQDLTTTEDGSYYLNGATSYYALLAVVREPDATWVIPSEDEWYKAAYHKNDGVTGDYFEYPTSNDTAPSNDLIEPDPGNNANCYENGFTIGSPYYKTLVGDFENSESPYGTFDQGGNVREWTEAILNGATRGVRGGSFGSNPCGGLCAADRSAGAPEYETYGIGFRVAYFVDCNRNGILDECDLDCGTAGGPCDVPGCGQSRDENGNGVLDDCAPDIPTVSEWGLSALVLLLLTTGAVMITRHQRVAGA